MKKTTKRITSIFAAIAMMLSVFCIAGATTADAATDRVSLYYADETWAWHGSSTYEVFVKTNDSAADQEVYVHYDYFIGEQDNWYDAEAEYVTTLDDGSKIWKASFTTNVHQFCIKYVADGVTYWDNNNGNDYTGTGLGTAPIALFRNYGFVGGANRVNARLQNYAYAKNVFVRYTTDGWNTYADQPLTYQSTNDDGTENWSTSLSLGYENTEDVEYAVCYQVNGQTYWANNFGENYGLDFVKGF